LVSRATLYRKERRARGLCAVAGCLEVTGEAHYRCPRHAQAHREAMAVRYEVKVEAREAARAAADEERAA
jgi:hypothetical protein